MDMPDELVERSSGKTAVQRVGLVLGLLVFLLVLLSPVLPGLLAQVATKLGQPVNHPEVVEVAQGARATLAVALLMVIWWVTEAIPIPATALLPGMLLPFLHVTGIDNGKLFPFTGKVSFAGYAEPVIYLFLAGFLLAAAMRKTGFDRRITLTVLSWKLVNRSPRMILFGVMAITAFLSMWMSNTATAAMMLPIALGILAELKQKPGQSAYGGALMLGVAWAASIGGMATIIGTPPNGIVVGILRNQGLADIDFVTWLKMGLPISIVGLVAAWLVLQVVFRFRDVPVAQTIATLQEQRKLLGKRSVEENVSLVVFLLVILMWGTQPFWQYVLPEAALERVSRFGVDEIGLFCALLLFIVPVELPSWRTVLSWRDSKYVDWGTLVLFGGGITLSNAMFRTGCTDWLASSFVELIGKPSPWLCLTLFVLLIDFVTEVTSNTAVTSMMTPVLIGLAPSLGLSPVTLAVAGGLAASMAFMLPVGTPPNALVYGTGYFRIGQMIRAGFLNNLVQCGVAVACLYYISGKLLGAIVL